MHERRRRPSVREDAPEPAASRRRSRRGLDWFVFFVADVQTGFGPFIAVYLTSQKWTQIDIGFVLTVGGLISLFGQIPGGALLDRLQSPRRAAAICDRHHLRERADPCAVADVSGRDGSRAFCRPAPAACWARRSQRSASASCRAIACRRPVRPQRRVRLGRHRPCGRSDGRLRLLHFEPGGVLRHGRAWRAGADRAVADQAERHRSTRSHGGVATKLCQRQPMR